MFPLVFLSFPRFPLVFLLVFLGFPRFSLVFFGFPRFPLVFLWFSLVFLGFSLGLAHSRWPRVLSRRLQLSSASFVVPLASLGFRLVFLRFGCVSVAI